MNRGARSRTVQKLALVVLVACAVWPVVVSVLWLATSEKLPIVDVRWAQAISDEQRHQIEREVGLVVYRAKEPGTWSYFLRADDPTNLERIVRNTFIEDTAHVDRGAFVLDHPESDHLWIGYRWPPLRNPFYVYLSLFGCAVASLVAIAERYRRVELAEESRLTAADRMPPGLFVSGILLGCVVLVQLLWFLDLTNDHMGYLAMSRQVLHGDMPIRDFIDHGAFLHILLSAALQYLFGHRMLAEMLMCWVFIALGVVITYRLVFRVVGSRLASLLLMLPAVVLVPRPYSFPKTFLYPLGLLVVWRYLEKPETGRLLVAGGVAAIALMTRVDHGVVLLLAGLVSVALVHLHHPGQRFAAALATLVVGFTAMLTPFLVYLGTTAGIIAHFKTVWAFGRYAQEKGQSWSEMVSVRTLSLSDGWLAPGQALSFLYDALLILSALAGVRCLVAIPRDLWRKGAVTLETARLAAVTTVWFLSAPILLRDNFYTRLPDMAIMIVILSAFFLRLWWQSPEKGDAGGTQVLRGAVRQCPRVAVSWLAIATFLYATFLHLGGIHRLTKLGSPEFLEDSVAQGSALVRSLAKSPPLEPWLPSQDDRTPPGLAEYLAACTAPTDRLLVTWYAPQLFFLTDRAFAGNQWVYVSGFHDSPSDQVEIVERLRRQSVPLVLVRSGDHGNFWPAWRLLAGYLDERYRPDAEFSDGTTLYVDRQRPIVRRLAFYNLPCFR